MSDEGHQQPHGDSARSLLLLAGPALDEWPRPSPLVSTLLRWGAASPHSLLPRLNPATAEVQDFLHFQFWLLGNEGRSTVLEGTGQMGPWLPPGQVQWA